MTTKPQPFPCPHCGDTDDWSAAYLTPTSQGVHGLALIDGELVADDYDGRQDTDDCGDTEYYTCGCGESVNLDGTPRAPTARTPAEAGYDLAALVRRLIAWARNPEPDGEHGRALWQDAERLIATIDTPTGPVRGDLRRYIIQAWRGDRMREFSIRATTPDEARLMVERDLAGTWDADRIEVQPC